MKIGLFPNQIPEEAILQETTDYLSLDVEVELSRWR